MLYYFKKLLNLLKINKDKIIINHIIDKHLPTRKLNYNISQNLFSNYKKEFLSSYLDDILPLAFRNLQLTNDFPKILDIGCGFAPMCLASKIYRDIWLKKKLTNEIYYVGIDIREDSINVNKKNFEEYKEIVFVHHKISNSKIDYVGDFAKYKQKSANHITTNENSNGNEGNYKLPFLFKANIQWSNSLITHVTPQTLDNILKFKSFRNNVFCSICMLISLIFLESKYSLKS